MNKRKGAPEDMNFNSAFNFAGSVPDDITNPSFQRVNQSFPKKGNPIDTTTSVPMVLRIDPARFPELLERYERSYQIYKEDEFTQQSELFIRKISCDKKVPIQLKNMELHQILIAISKTFMLSEYEIIVFSCILDHTNWQIGDIVQENEEKYLQKFDAWPMFKEAGFETRKVIMYLLVLAFSLKNYLCDKDKDIIDPIQANCENSCDNFINIYNRWQKSNVQRKFNYSAPEINKKYKSLSKKETAENSNTIKDYNKIVNNIMTLTGQVQIVPKPNLKPELGLPRLEKNSSDARGLFMDFNLPKIHSDETFGIKSFESDPMRQNRPNQGFQKRQPVSDMNEDSKKKLKTDELGLSRGLSIFKDLEIPRGDSIISQGSVKPNDDEFLAGLGNLPDLARNPSNMSLPDTDTLPGLSRFESNPFFNK